MKLKMDINRWRTAADLTVLEKEPMYAGSMYVHKLIVQANLYETDNSQENLRASFSVNGELVAQSVPLVKTQSCEDGYAWYEALIPSLLFKAVQRVNMSLALCTVVDGAFSQILATSPIQFVIEGDASVFENRMSEEDRQTYDGQLSEVLAELNDMRVTIDNFPPGPQGPKGEPGKGIASVRIEDGQIKMDMTDGTTEPAEGASIYGPTDGGEDTGVQVLVPHGDGREPTWETVSIEQNGLEHTIKIGPVEVGKITLPQDTYVDDVVYNENTHILTFKYNSGSGKPNDTVDLSSLVDVYTPGNGLQKSGNEFSIKINGSYLSVSANGLSVAAQTIADLAKIKLNNSAHTAHETTFYAPTTTRSSNSTNSCWVLVPNGTSAAPVWKELEVVKSGLIYTLKLGGIEFGKIQLTQEVYLDSVSYNSTSNKLSFTYNTASGKSTVDVDLTDLVDAYSAGNGLQKSGNAFSVKIADGSEDYLQSTANGIVFNESALPIPQVTGADAGKFLRINTEGKIVAETIPIAEEMSL